MKPQVQPELAKEADVLLDDILDHVVDHFKAIEKNALGKCTNKPFDWNQLLQCVCQVQIHFKITGAFLTLIFKCL